MNVTRNIYSKLLSYSSRRKLYLADQRRQKHVRPTVDKTSGYRVSVPIVTKPKEFREVKIPVPWGHIAGKWWGPTDVQPLLCVHGWQDNACTWDRLAPLFSPHVALLCVDLPGHGRSSHYPPGCAYHFLEYVKTVRRVVKHHGWQKVTLLGHSLGSITSYVYACVFPQQVHRFIGIDAMKPFSKNPTSCLRRGGKLMDTMVSMDAYNVQTAPRYTREEAVDRLLVASDGWLTRSSAECLLQRGLAEVGDDGKHAYTKDVRVKVLETNPVTEDGTLVEMSRSCRCHVLVINASQGLVYDTEKQHEEVWDVLRQGAQSFHLHTVDGTHHVHLNNPERVFGIINDFIDATKE